VRSMLAATFMIVLLAMSCAYCAAGQQPVVRSDPIEVARLGGPGWRVMGADMVDAIEAIPAMRQIYAVVQACSGGTKPYDELRVFMATEIHSMHVKGWTGEVSGTWRGGNWIYIKRGMEPFATTWTLKHEMVHYAMQLSHPDVDDAMKACNVHYEAEAS